MKGCVTVGQVCAGHKNDLWFEVNGATASLRWFQERQNELWIGRRHAANQVLLKDPALLGPEARRYAHLPPGTRKPGVTRSAMSSLMSTRGSPAGPKAGPTVGPDDVRRSLPSKTATGPRVWWMLFSTAIDAAVSGQPWTHDRRSQPHDAAERSSQAVGPDVPPVLRVGRVVRHARHLVGTNARVQRGTDRPGRGGRRRWRR